MNDMLAARPAHVPPERVVDFDLNALPPAADFFAGWRTLHDEDVPAMLWTPRNGGHWMATRGDLIAALFTDTRHLSSRRGSLVPGLGEMLELIPVQSDPPDHAAERKSVLAGFSSRRIVAMEPEIRARARALIRGFAGDGGCEFMTAFAEALPVSVFLSMIDLPLSDQPLLRDLVTAVHRPDGTRTLEQLVAAIHAYLRPYVQERIIRPGDDMMSAILAAGVGGRRWTESEAMRLATNLLVGGLDTVAALFGFTMHFLADNPEHRARLKDRAIVSRAADEFTRRFGMTSPVRLVTGDMTADGVELRAGDMLVLPTMLHNIDDRAFPDAMTVDFDRRPVKHSTMGHGAHHCVGAALARVEMIVFLEEWFAEIPEFELDPAGHVKWHAGGVGTLTTLPLRWTSRTS